MGYKVTLAVSLHTADNAVRKKLMPVASQYPVLDVVSACRYYIKKTGRRITFEYALIAGINDSAENAAALASLLKGMICHVNLIRINETTEFTKKILRESKSKINESAFLGILNKNHISATIRRTVGNDIQAACGQLRSKMTQKS
jgi:23S rRNA (adenine2503-C2)-methyltransferase